MKILITRWQPVENGGDVIAMFNFQLDKIVTIRAAQLSKVAGRYHVEMPITQHKRRDGNAITAVGLAPDLYPLVAAAAETYHRGRESVTRTMSKPAVSNWLDRVTDLKAERDDAGLKRVLAA